MWARAALLALIAPAVVAGEPIEITAQPIPMIQGARGDVRLAGLAWRGGLELTSPDRRFGGLSGLVIEDDGARLVAITDTGLWLEATLLYDRDGALAGLRDAALSPMRDADGQVLEGKRDGDAEGLAAIADGYLVSFERRHRILRFAAPGANGSAFWAPPDAAGIAANGGIEALTVLADGSIMALTEDHFAAPGRLAGWILEGGAARPVTWPGDGYFKPTAMARLDDGRVLVLERGFTVIGGVKCRLLLIEGDPSAGGALAGREIARLQPPLQVDNLEGLAVRESNGETLVYLLSDDNFNAFQRTLLLMFALVE